MNYGAYIGWIQNSLVQAQYWHDPLNELEYSERSVFLADINNARPGKTNSTYKENLTKLEKLVLLKFTKDTMVDPKESEWFEFYYPGQAKAVQPLNESALYVEDRIGLKTLDESGRLDLLEVDGEHLQIDEQFFVNNVIKKYLI